MLKLGCAILSLWMVLNLVPSLIIVVNTMTHRGHTPALYAILDQEDVGKLDDKTLATLDSIAVYANGTNIGFCLLSLATIWMGLNRRLLWTFWGLLVGSSGALFAGVAADHMVGTVFPQVNIISAAILLIGFTTSAVGLFSKNQSGNHQRGGYLQR